MNRVPLKISFLSWLVVSGIMLFANSTFASSLLNCEAFFTYKQYEGNLPVNGGITFTNLSTGDFTDLAWDFGDGQFSTAATDSVDNFYAIDGIYTVCLTVWADQTCVNTYCSDIVVGNVDNICNLTDCVYPGDANKDGEANFYDLLKLGIGQGVTGPTRPNATIDWVGQYGPDWTESTVDGINYKHLDCDGNGVINEQDASAITGNYIAMDLPNPTAESGAPLIYVEFDQDTIYLDGNTSDPGIEVVVHLKIGDQEFPADNIYGIALYLDYPEDFVFEDSVFFEYENNSFFGVSNEVLWLPHHQYDETQIDIGITRKDGASVGGFGEIGQGVFIVSSDILDGRVQNGDVPFPVLVSGVRMVDSLGVELPVNLNTQPATLIFSKKVTTSTNDPELAQKVKVFPNPASEKVQLDLSDLDGNFMQIFNNIGQEILQQEIYDNQFEINVKNWNAGVYMLKIQTTDGVISKRLVLK